MAAPPPPPTWYAPKESDYRPEYDRDTANKAKQSWDSYWDWVHKFYSGAFLLEGWTDRAKDIIANVKDTTMKTNLQKQLNTLGIDISREWAKDNGIRKIDRDDLTYWGKLLTDAKKKDGGNGVEIMRIVEFLQKGVLRRLGRDRQ